MEGRQSASLSGVVDGCDQEEGQQKRWRDAGYQLEDAVGRRSARETRAAPSAPEVGTGQGFMPAPTAATPTAASPTPASAHDFFLQKFFAAGEREGAPAHADVAEQRSAHAHVAEQRSREQRSREDRSPDLSSLAQRSAAAAQPDASAGLDLCDDAAWQEVSKQQQRKEKSTKAREEEVALQSKHATSEVVQVLANPFEVFALLDPGDTDSEEEEEEEDDDDEEEEAEREREGAVERNRKRPREMEYHINIFFCDLHSQPLIVSPLLLLLLPTSSSEFCLQRPVTSLFGLNLCIGRHRERRADGNAAHVGISLCVRVRVEQSW